MKEKEKEWRFKVKSQLKGSDCEYRAAFTFFEYLGRDRLDSLRRGEVHKKKILFHEACPFNLPHICIHFKLKNTKITFCPFLKLTKTFLYS